MDISTTNHTNLSNSSFDKSLPKQITLEDLTKARDAYLKTLNTKGIKKNKIDVLKDEYISMRDCFFNQNKDLVTITVSQMNLLPQNERLRDDIFQQGFLALIKAIDNFSPNGDATFQTYAISSIKYSIKRFLSEMAYPFQIPHKSFSTASILTDSYNRLKSQLGRSPLPEEVFELAKKENSKFLPQNLHLVYPLVNRKYLSTSLPLSRNSDFILMDVLQAEPEEALDKTELRSLLKQRIELILSNFSERNRELIKCYFGIDNEKEYSLNDLRERFNISNQRIFDILNKCFKTFRENLVDEQSNDFRQCFLPRQKCLTVEQIIEWGEAYKMKKGIYPTYLSKSHCLPKGESWLELNQSLFFGERNLPPNTTLFLLFGEEAPLNRPQIIIWAKTYKTIYGVAPDVNSPNDTLPAGETWEKIDLAFRTCGRKLVSRCRSLEEFLKSKDLL